MSPSQKATGITVMVLAATASFANANPINQPQQIALAGEATAATIALPEIVVHPQSWYYNPYVHGQGQKASSLNDIPLSHFKVPLGYHADIALHVYTSGLGPCTEGAQPSQGCRHPTGNPIPPSHYERAPFNQ
jgi:hypothetical protein